MIRKKLISVVLTVVMILSLFPGTVFAIDELTTLENATYQTVTFTFNPKRVALTVTHKNGAPIVPQADGSYLLQSGDYTYKVTKKNYDTVQEDFIVADQDLSFDITLRANVDLTVYKDLTEGAWYMGHVEYSVANNLLIGVAKDQWGPQMNMTRGMFVTVLGKLDGVETSDYPTCAFTDVNDELYYASFIQWAYMEGLVAGIGGNEFAPDRDISREEIVQILMMYAAYKGIDVTGSDESAFDGFPDKDETSVWAKPAMIWATANHVINGDGTNLNSGDTATRAEAAAIFRGVIESILPANISPVITIAADGLVGITDPTYNDLFDGDAVQGIKDLIAAGAVYINDVQVPVEISPDVYSADKLDINGGKGLWKNEDGTWGYDVQILFKNDNLSYEDAVLNLVNSVTKLRGIDYNLIMGDGKVIGLTATIFDIAMANTLTKGSAYTTFTTVGEGDVNTTGKSNPSTINFPNANVTGNPQSQDVVLFWEDAEGWHLQRANSEVVTVIVSINGTSISGTINGQSIIDSRLSLQYSEPWNRPSQPIRAMGWMEEESVSVIQWTCAHGITVGISRGDGAKPALEAAIAKAENALATVKVSASGDGSDVSIDKMWVTQDYKDRFTQAVDDAKDVFNNGNATNAEYEGALYRLAQAYGGRTGDRFSWLENAYFGKGDDYGRKEAFDTGYNGTGFWTFAQSHYGTDTGL